METMLANQVDDFRCLIVRHQELNRVVIKHREQPPVVNGVVCVQTPTRPLPARRVGGISKHHDRSVPGSKHCLQ